MILEPGFLFFFLNEETNGLQYPFFNSLYLILVVPIASKKNQEIKLTIKQQQSYQCNSLSYIFTMSSTIEQILINNSNADAGIDHTDSGSLITFIGLPFLLYSILTCCCLVLFGVFLHFGWVLDDLTPRVANRNPQQMLHTALYYDEITEENNKIDKNQKKEEDAKEVKNEEREEKKTTTPVFSSIWLWLQLCYEHIKSIVWYPLAWIKWSYLLTLKQCLFGIPGTGTRNSGLHGPLLKVNVDGVVLLKYHIMLFKIALLVALLSTIILLPVYMTALCDPIIFGYGTCYYQEEQTKNNDFLCTTIFNLPPKLVSNNKIQHVFVHCIFCFFLFHFILFNNNMMTSFHDLYCYMQQYICSITTIPARI